MMTAFGAAARRVLGVADDVTATGVPAQPNKLAASRARGHSVAPSAPPAWTSTRKAYAALPPRPARIHAAPRYLDLLGYAAELARIRVSPGITTRPATRPLHRDRDGNQQLTADAASCRCCASRPGGTYCGFLVTGAVASCSAAFARAFASIAARSCRAPSSERSRSRSRLSTS
jgi:hypothetical protein